MMFRIHLKGERACFPRPECRPSLISYDVMPPFFARAIIEAIYWSPAIQWRIDRIHVLNKIEKDDTTFGGCPAARQVDLLNVAYVIEARLALTSCARNSDHAAQHASLVRRRFSRQQPFRPPFLGLAQYPAAFDLLSSADPLPISALAETDIDLGRMMNDLSETDPTVMQQFHARVIGGVLEIN